jgi:hypothetical protein
VPSALISVPVLVPPLTDQVTVWAGLLVPVTVAVKAWVAPFAKVTVAGLTVTEVTVGAPLPGVVTVTIAVPFFVASTVELALTVRLTALSSAATDRTPAALIVVLAPPPLTDQVTVWAGLPVPATVALKAWVAPFATLAVAGLTVTEVTAGVVGSSGEASFAKVFALFGAEAPLQPPAFPALTVKVYVVLGESPLIVAGEEGALYDVSVPPMA